MGMLLSAAGNESETYKDLYLGSIVGVVRQGITRITAMPKGRFGD